MSALRSHDQPAAGGAVENDTPFWRQCSMSSYPTKTTPLMVAHACVYVSWHHLPALPLHHTFPSGSDPWPNKHHSHSISVHAHTHAEIQGLVSVIEIKRSVSRGHDLVVSGDALLTPLEPGELRSRPRSLSLTFPPTIIHLFTSFHIRLVIDAYLASNENISVCVWVDCCRTCHEP